MLWRGRIYSPLPFVRSLWGTRINAGVWGTAAFPSVYRTDVHPFAFLPHSVKWQVFSFVLTIAGLVVAGMGGREWAAALLLGSGLVGMAATIAKNVAYALRSDVDSLPGNRLWYRTVVAYLHFIQPFARLTGQIRGVLAPPEVALPVAQRQTSRGPQPSFREATRALLLLSGSVTEDRFWSETWTSADRVLTRLTDWLRRSRAVGIIEVDDGWSGDRDVSVLVGRWAWLDTRALVEDHGAGKGLLRVSTHLRPTSLGIVSALALAAALSTAVVTGVALRWPLAGAVAALLAVAVTGFIAWRTAQTTAILHRGVEAVTTASRHDGDEIGAGARAARGPVGASHLRHAKRGAVPGHDSRARRRHLHAPRSGNGGGDRRAQGIRRRQRPGAGRVARHARRHRRGVERPRVFRRFQQPRDTRWGQYMESKSAWDIFAGRHIPDLRDGGA